MFQTRLPVVHDSLVCIHHPATFGVEAVIPKRTHSKPLPTRRQLPALNAEGSRIVLGGWLSGRGKCNVAFALQVFNAGLSGSSCMRCVLAHSGMLG